MKKITLSKKDKKEINKGIEQIFMVSSFFKKTDVVSIVDDTYLIRDGKLIFFYKDDKLVPSLKLLMEELLLKKIIVDMGAVKFVVKGADIMRPGIVSVDEGIKINDFVVIVDENNKKPLAIGIVLLSGEDLISADGGKVVLNIHYVGDEIWNNF